MQIFTYNDYLDYISNYKIKKLIKIQNKRIKIKNNIEKEKYKNKKIDLQICYIQENHVMTLNNISETKTDNHGKQPFPKTFLSNLFFCVLSAVLGFLLCKYL